MSDESTAQPAAAPAESAPATEITTDQALEAVAAAAQAQVPAAEPAVEAQKAADDKLAGKFAALARKEKQIRQQEKAVQQKLADMEARFKAQEEALKPYMSLKDKASKDPSSILEDLKAIGLDEKQLIEKYIFKQDPTPEEKQAQTFAQLQKQIEDLKAERQRERDEAKQREAEVRKQAEVTAKDNYLKHLDGFVAKNAEKYELIRTNGAVDLIYEVMEEHYNLTEKENGKGELLTEQEAADKVEDYLFEQAKKLIEVNKLKSLISKPAPEAKKPAQTATLSNSAAQKVPSQSEPYLSDAESKKRMAALIKFTS